MNENCVIVYVSEKLQLVQRQLTESKTALLRAYISLLYKLNGHFFRGVVNFLQK